MEVISTQIISDRCILSDIQLFKKYRHLSSIKIPDPIAENQHQK